VSLGSLKWLLGDRRGTNGTYPPMLTTHILRTLHCVAMAVGNNGVGVPNVVPDARNNDAGARDIVVNQQKWLYLCLL